MNVLVSAKEVTTVGLALSVVALRHGFRLRVVVGVLWAAADVEEAASVGLLPTFATPPRVPVASGLEDLVLVDAGAAELDEPEFEPEEPPEEEPPPPLPDSVAI